MTVKGILIEARRILFTHWVQKSFAVDIDGNDVMFNNPKAHGFCMLGGIRKAATNLGIAETPIHINAVKVLQSVAGYHLVSTNDRDDTTKGKVLGWFDKAIKVADKPIRNTSAFDPEKTPVFSSPAYLIRK